MTLNDYGLEVIRKAGKRITDSLYRLRIIDDEGYSGIESAKTGVTTAATLINTPINSRHFKVTHQSVGKVVYIGGPTVTVDGVASYPLRSGDILEIRGDFGGGNLFYGITSSGTIDVYVLGNY